MILTIDDRNAAVLLWENFYVYVTYELRMFVDLWKTEKCNNNMLRSNINFSNCDSLVKI